MTLVIGFSWPVGHDNSAAAILDGRLVFATEEERHTRNKHAVGEPPVKSLLKLFVHLRKLGADPSDVDAFAVNWTPRLFPFFYRNVLYVNGLMQTSSEIRTNRQRLRAVRHWVFGGDYVTLSKNLLRRTYRMAGVEFPSDAKVIPVEHHLAHAATAYFFSGFDSAVALTIDGSGERNSTVVWRTKNGEFEKLLAMDTVDSSIGLLYEALGTRVGYDVLEGPGKLMGLAPYGAASPVYDKVRGLLKINEDGSGDVPYKITQHHARTGPESWADNYASTIDHIVNKVEWNPRGKIDASAADIAWATQRTAEEAVMATAKWAKKNSGETRLVLAGGVALNAKINMELFYSHLFEDIFVFPGSNDAGGPIGAAAYVHQVVLGQKMEKKRLTEAYLGPDYSDEEVKAVVRASKWTATEVDDGMQEVANLVAQGKIVAVFQGRAELGPRALGNRSIVADPRKKENWDLVNKIKGREWWRPLAPSMLDAKRYFVEAAPHEFMIMMYRFLEPAKQRVPAVCHVDGTARPQSLERVNNPVWRNLIQSFDDLTGESLLVNTSFNLAGDPLVETPQDALRSFAVGGFDAIYMQGQLLLKR